MNRSLRYLPFFELLEDRITPTFYLVDSLADVVAVDGQLTLREAINAANTNAPSGDAAAGSSVVTDVITFDPSLAGKAIQLTLSEIGIRDNLRIEGFAENPVTIQADAFREHFDIGHLSEEIEVEISGLRLVNGSGGFGGSIFVGSEDSLVLRNVTIAHSNATQLGGGAIYVQSSSTVTIIDSELIDNTSVGDGGAIYATGGSAVTINNSTIDDNTADNGFGGGIYADENAVVTIQDSTISGNVGSRGAGVYAGENVGVTIESSTISGNTATAEGGGIANFFGTVTIQNSTIVGNQASHGGGVFSRESSFLSVANSTLKDNKAIQFGGGIYLHAVSAVVENSTISDNNANAGGGGIGSVSESRLTIRNSTISGNDVPGLSGVGAGGGILATDTVLTIANSSISANKALEGGGAWIHEFSSGDIDHTTIVFNSAEEGGGIYSQADVTARNSIFAGNIAAGNGPDIFGEDAADAFNLDYTLIQDISSIGGATLNETTPGSNIFGQDPLLRPLADNGGPTLTHALVEFSPAIDAGDPNYTRPPGSDQRGFPRIVNGRTDMGAVEHGGELRLFAGLLGDNRIVLFNADDPSQIEMTLTVTGLDAGDTLIGIDVRPSDGLLYGVGKRNRIYRIDLTTGVATRTAAMTIGLADGEAMAFDENLGLTDKILGLYRDSGGFYQGSFGSPVKWVRGEDNTFGNPWYFITPEGDFYAWDGQLSATGQLLHSFGTNVFKVPELLVFASTAQLPVDQQDDAQNFDNNLGLYVAAAGVYEDALQPGVKWLRGVNNSFGNPWYVIKNTGEFLEWDGNATATGNLLFTFDPLLYRHPELLYDASTAQLPAAEQDDAQNFDETLGLYVDSEGFYQGNDGNSVKWLRGKTNSFGNPWYFIDINGRFFEYDDSPALAHILLFDFDPLLFRNPELLYEASQLQLNPTEKAQAISLDKTLGLYRFKNDYFEDSGGVKWLRGEPNAFGQVWYFIRPNGEFVEWDGTGTNGKPLYTFDPTVFLHPQLIHEAFQPGLSPNFFGDTTEVGVDFDPVDDTLRVITDNSQNLEIDVETGETTAHQQVQDAMGGIPDLIAAAYSNNFNGTLTSALLNIDASRDVLTIALSDDSGVNTNQGSLGLDAGPVGGFDILGDDLGYAALGNGSSRLYTVDLNTGVATDLGKIGDDLMIYSLAALSPNLYSQATLAS